MDRILERDDELETLEAVVHGLAADEGRLVLVAGAAGIGKTTLVRGLRARVGDAARFVAGACEPLSVPVPLAPLREIAEAADGLDLRALETADHLVVANGLLDALARAAPVVAVVEDAHWADPTTLDVLRLLARRVESRPVALLVTYRDDEVRANPALGRLVGDLATYPAARRLALEPLSDAAVRDLAESAGVDADRVTRVTGGNPFLVVEAIAAGGKLPPSVRDAALARAARLSPEARSVVDAAAVVGQRMDAALLDAIAPGSADAVDEALARGVMVAEDDTLGFRHDLIRQAIEVSIAPQRRAQLQARVVAALTARPGPADHARLAHHAERAGMTADACRFAIAAAQEAERVGALRETSLQAERALRLDPGLPDADRFELLLQRTRASNFAITDLEDALGPAQEAVALAQRMGDQVRHGRALVALAGPLWSLDRVAEAKQMAQRAIAVLEPTGDDAALARAHASHLRMEATSFDPGVVIEAGPRALELAARAELEETRIDIAISIGLARGHRGDRGALEMLEQAQRDAHAAGLPIPVVRSLVNRVVVAGALREHAALDAAVREAVERFAEYQTTIPANAVDLYRARSLVDRGRWDDAVAIATRRHRNYAAEAPTALALAGIVGVRRGEPGADRLIEDAWAQLAGVPESSRHAAIRVALVEAAWIRGDRGAALAQLRAARESPAAQRFARAAGDLAVWSARCGVESAVPGGAPPAVALELAGDWRGAVSAWRELEAPYEAALAALPGDARAAREAVATLQRLGAIATARTFAREREARGARPPRGPRRSTLAHPAGLTKREQEVLEQLASGATNPAIAAALHISERTVAHHVSAILAKLEASNRHAAIERARSEGLLPER